jgi:heptosyltransferase III
MTVTRRAALRATVLGHLPGAGEPSVLDGRPATLPAHPRVLVVRPDHLGDVLFVGPALAGLRRAWSDAHVTLLVGPWAAPIAERLAGVDRVLTFDFPWFDRRPKGTPWHPYTRLARAVQRIRATGPYDIALVLRDDDYWSAWACAWSGVPVRVGHDHLQVRRLVTHVVQGATVGHAAAANLALVGAVTGTPHVTDPRAASGPAYDPTSAPLLFQLGDADHRSADALLGDLGATGGSTGGDGHRSGTDGRRSGAGGSGAGPDRRGTGAPGHGTGPIAVHPGSGAVVKRWRTDAWVETVHAITAPGETIVLTGSDAERDLTADLAARLDRPVLDLAGRTDLGTLAAVFARCRLVMGPDSGPLHLAVAVGTPTVHLYGPADPVRFGPWGPPDRHRVVLSTLPCAPCGRLDWTSIEEHPCIRDLAVPDVVAAARAVLEARSRA